jgi:hypothetical protein
MIGGKKTKINEKSKDTKKAVEKKSEVNSKKSNNTKVDALKTEIKLNTTSEVMSDKQVDVNLYLDLIESLNKGDDDFTEQVSNQSTVNLINYPFINNSIKIGPK